MKASKHRKDGRLLSDQSIAALTELANALASVQVRLILEQDAVYQSEHHEKLKKKEREGDI